MAYSYQGSSVLTSGFSDTAANYAQNTASNVNATLNFGEARCYMPVNGYASFNPYHTLATAGSCAQRAAAAAEAAASCGCTAAERLANAPTNVINLADRSSNCGCNCCGCNSCCNSCCC